MKALVVATVCGLSCGSACSRATYASLLPKLAFTVRYTQTQSPFGSSHAGVRTLAALQWAPTVVASYVPTRFELSPSSWLAPCDLDDLACFEELAVDVPEVARTDAP